MFNFPSSNFQIYTTDVEFVGGTYTIDEKIVSSRRSTLYHGTVSVEDAKVNVIWEHFADNSIALRAFTQNGKKIGGLLFPEAHDFLEAFDYVRVHNEDFFIYTLFRSLKQYFLVFLQFILCIIVLFTLKDIIIEGYTTDAAFTLLKCFISFICICALYKYIRPHALWVPKHYEFLRK